MASETMISNHHTKWHKNTETNDFYIHCHEKFKSHNKLSSVYDEKQ